LPRVALVGRPNVGKSSLFNRIIGRGLALVEQTPGVTRDPLEARTDWAGHVFTLTDTGGLVAPEGDPFAPLIARSAEERLGEADVAVMVVDGQAGCLPADSEVASRLRRWGGRVVLAVNKCESHRAAPHEFYALGLGEPIPVSAIHGHGVGDLLDAVVRALDEVAPAPPPAADAGDGQRELSRAGDGAAFSLPTGPVRVALVGRPNAGKSSLVNRLIGRDRLIVSELPGTTRDAVDVPWSRDGHEFVFVDTPGLRRPARVAADLERSSVARALRSLARADVAVLVVDARAGVTEQDQRIAGYAYERGRAAVVVANKWDLVQAAGDADDRARRLPAEVRAALPFLHYAPLVLTSARTGHGVERIPALLARVAAAHRQRLGTAEVNRVLREATALHAPPSHGGRALRLYYATQVAAAPPTLLCFVNDAAAVRADYARYLENRLRAAFPLEGTPLRLHFRSRRRPARLRQPGPAR
jgi:GTP-binding protein